jgi:phospholipase/carboxylesterase
MMLNLSGPIIRPKSGEPGSILVLLHGYGADGRDLIGLAPYFADLLPEPLVFSPNAPEPCALNPGGYQWFDLGMMPDYTRLEGIAPAAETVRTLLRNLWDETGLGPDKTLLIGFSQGGMLTLYTGLSEPAPLAGLVSFSGGLPLDQDFWPKIASKPPILLVHGSADEVVPPILSESSFDTLKSGGFSVEHHVSPDCPHGIAPDGLERARRFVAARLSVKAPKP